MKTLILYHSKTGFTAQYAQWLAQSLSCACVPYKSRKAISLDTFDAIAFGSGLRAGIIPGAKWFFRQAPRLEGKRLALFFIGAMPPDPAGIERAVQQNVPPEARERVPVFYLWGGLHYEKMGFVDKAMMAAFRKMLSAKKNPTPEDQEAIRMVASSFSKAERENLRELEAYLREGK